MQALDSLEDALAILIIPLELLDAYNVELAQRNRTEGAHEHGKCTLLRMLVILEMEGKLVQRPEPEGGRKQAEWIRNVCSLKGQTGEHTNRAVADGMRNAVVVFWRKNEVFRGTLVSRGGNPVVVVVV